MEALQTPAADNMITMTTHFAWPQEEKYMEKIHQAYGRRGVAAFIQQNHFFTQFYKPFYPINL